MVFIEKYMDAADEKNRELIKQKMTLWVNSCDARNEAARTLHGYIFLMTQIMSSLKRKIILPRWKGLNLIVEVI